MRSGFTRGLIIGGLIGASVSMMTNSERMNGRNKRRMMKAGKNLLRKSSHVVGDVVDLFR